MNFRGYGHGRKEAPNLAVREGGKTGACTSQRYSKYKLHKFHSHSLQKYVVKCALWIFCKLIYSYTLHVSGGAFFCSTSFQSILMASMCGSSAVIFTFSVQQEGRPDTVASPKNVSPVRKALIDKETINHSCRWDHALVGQGRHNLDSHQGEEEYFSPVSEVYCVSHIF